MNLFFFFFFWRGVVVLRIKLRTVCLPGRRLAAKLSLQPHDPGLKIEIKGAGCGLGENTGLLCAEAWVHPAHTADA